MKGKTQNTRLDVLKGYECDRKAKLSSHDGGHLHRPQERKPRITRSEDVSTPGTSRDQAGQKTGTTVQCHWDTSLEGNTGQNQSTGMIDSSGGLNVGRH